MANAPEKQAPTRRERFIKAARDIGVTEDEMSFRQRQKAVAGANSKSGKAKPTKRSQQARG
jgi:hypothetical protein